MASKKVNICRFCNSAVAPNHTTQLFSTKSLSINLPVRLRTLLQLPVNADDSPNHSCRPCMQSFLTSEMFIVTAKLTFESKHVVADRNTELVTVAVRDNIGVLKETNARISLMWPYTGQRSSLVLVLLN